MSTEPLRMGKPDRDSKGEECSARNGRKWPLERVLFAMAGTMTLLSALLVALVSPWFLLLTVFVGLNQWMFVAIGACPASVILSRAFGFRSITAGESR